MGSLFNSGFLAWIIAYRSLSAARQRLKVDSERPKFVRKPAASQNQSFQKNVRIEPFAEFACSSPLVLCHSFSFSGQLKQWSPLQGPSTPLNGKFSSSSCSFFCQLTIHSQALQLSVCREFQAADEKNLNPYVMCFRCHHSIDRLRILFLEKVMACPVQEVGREGCSRPDPCGRHQCVSCMTNS